MYVERNAQIRFSGLMPQGVERKQGTMTVIKYLMERQANLLTFLAGAVIPGSKASILLERTNIKEIYLSIYSLL
ncbi:hypothetical protein GGC63_001528 [Paenibacillus sp. OAS669]|nr:hypothetical protein [Paenibacillus sp. OAS669]